MELERIELLNKRTTIDGGKVRGILEQMKNTLLTSDEADQKRVLQDFVEQVVIQPSDQIDSYDIEIICRFSSGVEDGT